jgi:hypothetical protein
MIVRVRIAQEEAACEYCGSPFDIGDRYYLSRDEKLFCDKHCEADYRKWQQELSCHLQSRAGSSLLMRTADLRA